MRPKGAFQCLCIAIFQGFDNGCVFTLPYIGRLWIEAASNKICDDLKLYLELRVEANEERVSRRCNDHGVERDVGPDELRSEIGATQPPKALLDLLEVPRAEVLHREVRRKVLQCSPQCEELLGLRPIDPVTPLEPSIGVSKLPKGATVVPVAMVSRVTEMGP